MWECDQSRVKIAGNYYSLRRKSIQDTIISDVRFPLFDGPVDRYGSLKQDENVISSCKERNEVKTDERTNGPGQNKSETTLPWTLSELIQAQREDDDIGFNVKQSRKMVISHIVMKFFLSHRMLKPLS
jgi:hypothetical protein